MKICNSSVWMMLFCLLVSSCFNKNRLLEDALNMAGDNRKELERVLEHYRDSSLKYSAACFIIENMPGAYSVDPQIIEVCDSFYEAYDVLAKKYDYIVCNEWGEQVDSLWKYFNSLHNIQFEKYKQDIQVMTANQLIKEIDLSFRAWKENVFTRNCSFEDFCEYILPYRRQNGLLIDDSRQMFYERNYGKYFVKEDSICLTDADSLLFAYRHLTHSSFWGTHIPIYNVRTFEKLRHGLCAQRCWYNSLLFSSLGMAVAIDFVPAWGNRNNSHSWNVLIENDKIYPFDAFWEVDRWKYTRLYNNIERDRWWGKFRLPKVFRYTYSNHFEGPLADIEMNMEDVPLLFRNFKMKDVSTDYFETTDVTVTLTGGTEEAKYAYLSVFNSQEWCPVQWGRIEKGKATFKAMGRDIVYLPVLYKKGQIYPAGAVFLLTKDGKIENIEKEDGKETVFLRLLTGTSYYNPKNWYAGCMNNTTIWGVKDGKEEEKLARFPWWMPLERTTLSFKTETPYRIIRLKLPTDSIVLGDIIFRTEQGQIKDVKVATTLYANYPNESPEMLVDAIGATGFRGKAPEYYVDFDLGREYVVSQIIVSPFLRSTLFHTDYFELLYWKSGWQSLGVKQGTDNYLQFDDVPVGALLLLRRCNAKSRGVERVFRYKEGEVRWY
jgi:hypothetical protein